MRKGSLFKIDKISDNDVVLGDGLTEFSLPQILFPSRSQVGDEIVLVVSDKEEYEKEQKQSAQQILQELIKEE